MMPSSPSTPHQTHYRTRSNSFHDAPSSPFLLNTLLLTANHPIPLSFHPTSPCPPLSAADVVSFLNPKRLRRSLPSYVLLLAAASVFVLASVKSYGGIDSFGTLRLIMKEGSVMIEAASEEHPIFALMREGEKQWQEVYSSQAETFEQAVSLYQSTFHRPPPAGFPLWWDYTRNHSVHFTNPSMYASLEATLAPFRGLSPEFLRSQVREFDKIQPEMGPASRMFVIWIENGACKGTGQEAWPKGEGPRRSGWEFCKKIESIAHLLPDIPPFIYSTRDFGSVLLSDEHKRNLTSIGLTADSTKLMPEGYITPPYFSPSLREHSPESAYLSVGLSCPPDSPANSFYLDPLTDTIGWPSTVDQYALPKSRGGFVKDFERQSDVCYNTELRRQQGSLLQWLPASPYVNRDTKEPDSRVIPIFSQSMFPSHSDFLVPQLYGHGDERVWNDVAWENKSDTFVWRGGLTGVTYPGSPLIGGYWRESQRMLLNAVCKANTGFLDLLWANGTLLQRGTTMVKSFAEDYFDCGLTHFPPYGYDSGKEINAEVTLTPRRGDYENFKFVGDVDGFGWSGRFRDLMRIGSVVIKSTAFPEWHSSQLIPWYHYVPMRYDSSDLYQLMSFFVGFKKTGVGKHDEEARKIAERGKAFVEAHWRKENEIAYLWRLLLEYRRLYELPTEGDMKPEEMQLRPR